MMAATVPLPAMAARTPPNRAPTWTPLEPRSRRAPGTAARPCRARSRTPARERLRGAPEVQLSASGTSRPSSSNSTTVMLYPSPRHPRWPEPPQCDAAEFGVCGWEPGGWVAPAAAARGPGPPAHGVVDVGQGHAVGQRPPDRCFIRRPDLITHVEQSGRIRRNRQPKICDGSPDRGLSVAGCVGSRSGPRGRATTVGPPAAGLATLGLATASLTVEGAARQPRRAALDREPNGNCRELIKVVGARSRRSVSTSRASCQSEVKATASCGCACRRLTHLVGPPPISVLWRFARPLRVITGTVAQLDIRLRRTAGLGREPCQAVIGDGPPGLHGTGGHHDRTPHLK
jgi:hypothetical protein